VEQAPEHGTLDRKLSLPSPPPPNQQNQSNTSHRHNFWLRIGIALLSDSILTILTSICIFKGNWHPIAALSTSIVWCGLWTLCATWNALFAARDEVEFDRVEEWYRLCYAEVGLQVAMAVAYVGMAWFAGVAVSRWRKGGGKREGEGEV